MDFSLKKTIQLLGYPHAFGKAHVRASTIKSILVGALEPWNFMTFHSVGNVKKTSQLTFTPSFFRGVWAQPPSRLTIMYYG